MKLSDAILKGMERFPKQMRGKFFNKHKTAACVMGCAIWAVAGEKGIEDFALQSNVWERFEAADTNFYGEFGARISTLNDEMFLREDIAGMLKAIGE